MSRIFWDNLYSIHRQLTCSFLVRHIVMMEVLSPSRLPLNEQSSSSFNNHVCHPSSIK